MNRLTKELFFVVLCLCAGIVSVSAQPVLTRNPENRKADRQLLTEGSCIGVWNDLYCWFGKGSDDRFQVALVDASLATLHSVPLPFEDKTATLLSTVLCDDAVYVIHTESPDKQHTSVYATKVALDTNQPADARTQTDLLDTFTYSRKDQCLVWAASSSNGLYHAVASVVVYKERKEYEARIHLFDKEMQPVWVKNYPLKVVDQLHVTNRGEVVAVGHEHEGDDEHIVFSILSRRREDSFDAVVNCFPIRELHIAAMQGRHVLAMGTYSPNADALKDNQCAGIVAMSFDMDSAFMTGFSMRPFQNEDLCMFYNRRTSRRIHEETADYVSPVAVKPTDFGAVMVLGRNFMRGRIEDNGVETSTYIGMGLHIVAMDTVGEITYVRNLRRNDCQVKSDALLATPVFSRYGTVYLLKSEHKKSPQTYSIARDSKEFSPGSKSNLVLYTIGPTGEVEKTVVEQNTPHSLFGAFMRQDDTFAIFTADGKRVRLSELRLR